MAHLEKNAKRAHPNRDNRTERSRLELKPMLQILYYQALKGSCEYLTAAQVCQYE